MKKKSQVSLIVILGVVLLVIISMFIFIRISSAKTEIKRQAGETIDFSNVRTNVKLYVDDCLEQTTLRAIDNYGLQNSETQIENYINIYLISCLNRFEYLKEQNYDVKYGSPDPTIEITDNVLFVDLVFPVTISKGEEEISIQDFQHKLKCPD